VTRVLKEFIIILILKITVEDFERKTELLKKYQQETN